MIDDSSKFHFPEFTDEFLDKMKDELPSLLDLATTYAFDFEGFDLECDKYKK